MTTILLALKATFLFYPLQISVSIWKSLTSAVVCQLIMSHLSGGLQRRKYDSEGTFYVSVLCGFWVELVNEETAQNYLSLFLQIVLLK